MYIITKEKNQKARNTTQKNVYFFKNSKPNDNISVFAKKSNDINDMEK